MYICMLFLRPSYEDGTPHCRFQSKPEALGAGRIPLFVYFRKTLYGFRIEPLFSHIERHALVFELWDYHV
jgi:hypothetical protein